MLTTQEAQERAQNLVDMAKKSGADAADAFYSCDASMDVEVRLGALEGVGRNEGEDISLRVFVGQQSSTVSSSNMNMQILSDLVDRAMDMAKETPADKYAGLAPEEMLMRTDIPDLDCDDGGDPTPEALREIALECEEAARAVSGVTNSAGAGMSAGRSIYALATSHGFVGGRSTSSYNNSVSVIAGEGDNMERDYAWRSARHLGDLENPASIGKRAGERTVKRMNPIQIKSGNMPILFDPRVGASLISHLIGAISGPAIARKTSFLLDKLGEKIFDSSVNIVDNPLRLRGLASRAFDGEGLPRVRSSLIENGVLNRWLLDSASARQLDLHPTGHASLGGGISTTNISLEAGTTSKEALMADVKEGIYVTELAGQGVNPVTGDYSRGASGHIIRDGIIGEAVTEITIAGNLIDMFAAMSAADDLEFIRGTNVPTLRIDGMMVASG